MENRVAIHKERRKDTWRNIEAPLFADRISFREKEVVLIDCLTLWATNWFFEKNEDVKEAISALKKQIESLIMKDATFIIVTNEVGLGGVSANTMQRLFADLQGEINQYVATLANDVYLTISGIPVKIK